MCDSLKQIFITFDLDYDEEYVMIPKVIEELGNTPATFFLVGKFLKELPNLGIHELGNHTLNHKDWDIITEEEKLKDLKEFPFKTKVYRSPHLRYSEWVDTEMVKLGYQKELPVSKCPFCNSYFSNHHFEQGCVKGMEESFEELCKQDYVNIFLDPKRLKKGDITKLIKIANGNCKRISEYQGGL